MGFKIIERNYRCCYGEVDIVAMENGTYVFVEVKARRTQAYGVPQMAVNFKKQKQLSKVASHYMVQKRLKDIPARFDVIAVNITDDVMKAELIRNAFECRL